MAGRSGSVEIYFPLPSTYWVCGMDRRNQYFPDCRSIIAFRRVLEPLLAAVVPAAIIPAAYILFSKGNAQTPNSIGKVSARKGASHVSVAHNVWVREVYIEATTPDPSSRDMARLL